MEKAERERERERGREENVITFLHDPTFKAMETGSGLEAGDI